MIAKRGALTHLMVLLFFIFLARQLAAQMNPIYRFKKVTIPVALHIKDFILPKGAYDLEFLRVPNPLAYYLRILKKGKILHLLQGEDFPYENSSSIPRKPTLKMSKNKSEKSLIIVFESGSDTENYGNLRARYHLDYETD